MKSEGGGGGGGRIYIHVCKPLKTTLYVLINPFDMCTYNQTYRLTCSCCQDADQRLKNVNCSSLDHGGENDKSLCPTRLNTALNTGFQNSGCHIDIIKMNDAQVANKIKGIIRGESHSNKDHSDWSVTSVNVQQ